MPSNRSKLVLGLLCVAISCSAWADIAATRRSAEAGDASAQVELGYAYLDGGSVPQDFAQALVWFRKAAAQGNGEAERGIASMYWDGLGVKQDYTEAVAWYRKAADHGSHQALVDLGFAYEKGRGVAKDDKQAFACYRKAVDLGNGPAIVELARLYRYGKGTEQDIAEAVRLLHLAGSKGIAGGAGLMYEMRQQGLITEEDAPGLTPGTITSPGSVSVPGQQSTMGFGGSRNVLLDEPRRSGQRLPHAYALVIGAEQYRKPIPAVPFATNDSKAIVTYFTDVLGVPAANVKSFENPTLSDFNLGLKWLSNQVAADGSPDVSLFVYYAGHGVPEIASKTPYLLPVDANPGYVAETGMSLTAFVDQLGKLNARTLMIVDACFTGTAARSGAAAGLMGGKRPAFIDVKMPTQSNVVVFSAVNGEQTSNAYPEGQHGLFTYYILKGLSGEAKGQQGNVTLKSLYDYVSREVKVAARRMNQEQTPTLSSDGATDQVLVAIPK